MPEEVKTAKIDKISELVRNSVKAKKKKNTKAKDKRISVPAIEGRKGGIPIVCLTAYSAPMAQFLDAAADILLVGDSLNMVMYGMDSTLGVSLETMIAHGAAVVRGSLRPCVVVDMPFGSYQESPAQAFASAARVLAETGCSAVKIEGGEEMVETVRFLRQRGIPVMGHVGLRPQSVNVYGGYGARGRDTDEAERIMADARAIASAGAFSLVIEGVVEPLAREITEIVPIPTIGIGASAACDGQVLVSEDLLGLFGGFSPSFVKRYANLGEDIERAVQAFAEDVKARRFPGPEHCFSPKPAGKKK
jgi:3-methyl-2-oxobutanoate hydroxymethyltransferase